MTRSPEQNAMKSLIQLRTQRRWQDIVSFIRALPSTIRDTELIQQQLGFSLNRLGADGEAESILTNLLGHPGDHSETLGILGRVYKDRWERAGRVDPVVAEKHLTAAINTYARGFETNPNNGYPGINLVTLLMIRDPVDPRLPKLFETVERAVELKLRTGIPDYFDYATQVELYVVSNRPDGAQKSLDIALGKVREPWEPETTAHNLRLFRTAKEAGGEQLAWVSKIERVLVARAGLSDTQFTSASA